MNALNIEGPERPIVLVVCTRAWSHQVVSRLHSLCLALDFGLGVPGACLPGDRLRANILTLKTFLPGWVWLTLRKVGGYFTASNFTTLITFLALWYHCFSLLPSTNLSGVHPCIHPYYIHLPIHSPIPYPQFSDPCSMGKNLIVNLLLWISWAFSIEFLQHKFIHP